MIHFRHYLLCKHTLLLSIDKLRHLEPEIQDILQHEGREYRLEQVLPDPPIQQHQPLHFLLDLMVYRGCCALVSTFSMQSMSRLV